VREELLERGEHTSLNVPLLYKGLPLGLMRLIETREERHFSSDEIELARGIGEQGALAFQNARLYGSLERLAITDGLTGLHNHRYFYERLAQEVARAARYQLPLSLLMLDVDDFKLFNDHFGHRAGDALLHDLGALLIAQTREKVDLVARYGGEEFAVILPSTGVDGATSAALRLRDAVQGDGVESGLAAPVRPGSGGDGAAARVVGERIRRRVESEGFVAGEQPPVVTVSVGVASLHEHASTVDGLVDEADRGLYRPKALGKNCVEVAGT
jgi:diguanylate cyclase (GGDEF)-like protein